MEMTLDSIWQEDKRETTEGDDGDNDDDAAGSVSNQSALLWRATDLVLRKHDGTKQLSAARCWPAEIFFH